MWYVALFRGSLVQQKFEKYGQVKAVTILKGFAFVQYGSPDEAEKAIEVRTKRNVVHVCRNGARCNCM